MTGTQKIKNVVDFFCSAFAGILVVGGISVVFLFILIFGDTTGATQEDEQRVAQTIQVLQTEVTQEIEPIPQEIEIPSAPTASTPIDTSDSKQEVAPVLVEPEQAQGTEIQAGLPPTEKPVPVSNELSHTREQRMGECLNKVDGRDEVWVWSECYDTHSAPNDFNGVPQHTTVQLKPSADTDTDSTLVDTPADTNIEIDTEPTGIDTFHNVIDYDDVGAFGRDGTVFYNQQTGQRHQCDYTKDITSSKEDAYYQAFLYFDAYVNLPEKICVIFLPANTYNAFLPTEITTAGVYFNGLYTVIMKDNGSSGWHDTMQYISIMYHELAHAWQDKQKDQEGVARYQSTQAGKDFVGAVGFYKNGSSWVINNPLYKNVYGGGSYMIDMSELNAEIISLFVLGAYGVASLDVYETPYTEQEIQLYMHEKMQNDGLPQGYTFNDVRSWMEEYLIVDTVSIF